MFHQDDNDDVFPPSDLPFAGWTAPRHVVTQHVEAALAEAARLAGKVLDHPSEAAIMQIFQTMMDRTTFAKDGHDSASPSVH